MENGENNIENLANEKSDMGNGEFNKIADEIKSEFENGQTPTKRGRGRPRKNGTGEIARPVAPAGPAPAPVWTAESAGPLVELPFLSAQMITGSGTWKLEPDEKNALAVPAAGILNEYVGAGKYAAIIAFSCALAVVGGKKWGDYKKEIAEKIPPKNEA